MKRFKFKKTKDYGRQGPAWYEAKPQPYRKRFEKCKAEFETGVSGPKTAFAKITFYNSFFTTHKHGYYLYAHFSGYNCYRQAERWCNWLLNNPPTWYGIYIVNK